MSNVPLFSCLNIFASQEIDLATETISTIQSGSRKLLSKASPVYAIHANDGLLYSANSPLDGAAVKVLEWKRLKYCTAT